MAVYYDKAGDAAAAESQLRQAIKIDPGYADACNYLGYMFAEKGVNLDEAVALVKKALEADPGNGAYIDSLGWAYYRKGDIAGALSELEKAAALEPLDPEIRAHLEEVRSKKR
jgi:Flp pilus assembly protein TadD